MVETWRWIKTPYSIFLLVLNVGNFREWSQSSLVIIIPATHPFPAVETKQGEFLWLLRLQPVAVKNPQLSLPEMDSNSTWIGGEAGIGFTWVLPHFLVANYLLYYILYIYLLNIFNAGMIWISIIAFLWWWETHSQLWILGFHSSIYWLVQNLCLHETDQNVGIPISVNVSPISPKSPPPRSNLMLWHIFGI